MSSYSRSFFFYSPEFIFRNQQSKIISFRDPHATVYFSWKEQRLISLDKSPFGGFVIEEPGPNSLDELVNVVISYAKANAIKAIEIRNYPKIYAPENAAKISDVLTRAGFDIKYRDITQVLPVNTTMPWNSRKKSLLKNSLVKGFKFDRLAAEQLPDADGLFLQSREYKDYPVTMSLDDFKDAFQKFPKHYSLFGVFDGVKLIAAAVTIHVNDDILYYFFAGDDLNYRKLSPLTFLLFNIVQYALSCNYKLLDLGLSTDRGMLNPGLYAFKKSFGALDSEKLTFEKKL